MSSENGKTLSISLFLISNRMRRMKTTHCIENYDTVIYLLITKECVLSMKTINMGRSKGFIKTDVFVCNNALFMKRKCVKNLRRIKVHLPCRCGQTMSFNVVKGTFSYWDKDGWQFNINIRIMHNDRNMYF